MSLIYASLNSGSNGNCYYIGNANEAVLIDVGLSCREIEKRFSRSRLDIQKVKAIFISHEHSDHIKGVEVLSRKYRLPVYITAKTKENSRLYLEKDLYFNFKAYQNIQVGELSVTPFPKLHDAVDPHSFVVSSSHFNIGVFTDIGSSCEHVVSNFKKCQVVFLESNYDDIMLDAGMYPYYLKQRIKSDSGHLSNSQAYELFENHKTNSTKHILLSHLSKDNNSPEKAIGYFKNKAGETHIEVASRYQESRVYEISYDINTNLKLSALHTSNQFHLFEY